MLILFYLILCLLVAWGFSNTSWGFGGGFLFSLLLSPLVGLIVMLFMPDKKVDNVQTQILLNQQQLLQQQLNLSKGQESWADELLKLKKLYDEKVLTQEEYEAQKKKILDK